MVVVVKYALTQKVASAAPVGQDMNLSLEMTAILPMLGAHA